MQHDTVWWKRSRINSIKLAVATTSTEASPLSSSLPWLRLTSLPFAISCLCLDMLAIDAITEWLYVSKTSKATVINYLHQVRRVTLVSCPSLLSLIDGHPQHLSTPLHFIAHASCLPYLLNRISFDGNLYDKRTYKRIVSRWISYGEIVNRYCHSLRRLDLPLQSEAYEWPQENANALQPSLLQAFKQRATTLQCMHPYDIPSRYELDRILPLCGAQLRTLSMTRYERSSDENELADKDAFCLLRHVHSHCPKIESLTVSDFVVSPSSSWRSLQLWSHHLHTLTIRHMPSRYLNDLILPSLTSLDIAVRDWNNETGASDAMCDFNNFLMGHNGYKNGHALHLQSFTFSCHFAVPHRQPPPRHPHRQTHERGVSVATSAVAGAIGVTTISAPTDSTPTVTNDASLQVPCWSCFTWYFPHLKQLHIDTDLWMPSITCPQLEHLSWRLAPLPDIIELMQKSPLLHHLDIDGYDIRSNESLLNPPCHDMAIPSPLLTPQLFPPCRIEAVRILGLPRFSLLSSLSLTLQTLILESINCDHLEDDAIINFLSVLPQLRRFSITLRAVRASSSSSLSSTTSGDRVALPNLTGFHIRSVHQGSTHLLTRITTPSLTSLTIDNLSVRSLLPFLDSVASTLASLVLNRMNITGRSQLHQQLMKLTSLVILNSQRPHFDLEIASRAPSLQHYRVGPIGTSFQLVAMATRLPLSLTRLSLLGCRLEIEKKKEEYVYDDDIRSMITLVRRLSNLRVIEIAPSSSVWCQNIHDALTNRFERLDISSSSLRSCKGNYRHREPIGIRVGFGHPDGDDYF
jgi:hypothetical protein